MFGELDMSLDKAKEIVAIFLKINSDDIHDNTRIDNSVIKSSVLVHRMFSELKKNGFEINNFSNLKTFGDLEKYLNGQEVDSSSIHNEDSNLKAQSSANTESLRNIGVDIESSLNLPDAVDFYDEQFYTDNFTRAEIAYCSSKKNPKSCFAGRFAAKEAIIKANKKHINTKFSNLEISVAENGQPLFEDMSISISHLNLNGMQFSTAVAYHPVSIDTRQLEIKINQNTDYIQRLEQDLKSRNKIYFFILIFLTLILILLISL
jgi:phosphopantetheine--protein transferase-like protein